MKIEGKKVLFVGAHTDDVEIGCGGTIFKLQPKNEILICTFSSCAESVPEGFDKNALEKEFLNAMDYLKIDNHVLLDFPVRHFSEYRQDILETLYDLGKELKPDIVFYHSDLDKHQDHSVINQECYRAFKKNSMLITYELPGNNTISEGNYFVAKGSSLPEQVAPEALESYIMNLVAQDSTTYIALHADQNIAYKEVVKVLDIANQHKLKLVIATQTAQK